MTNSTANDSARRPIGFGKVLFADFGKKVVKRAAQEQVAFAA